MNQYWNRVKQLKGKDPKEVNILEVQGAQYKDSKIIANKVCETLAELYFSQKLRPLFKKEGILKEACLVLHFSNKKNSSSIVNDHRFQILFYMEDLEISYCHQNWKVVERNFKDRINIVEKFGQKNCFKFSASKNSMLHFTKLSILPPIALRLGNTIIQK